MVPSTSPISPPPPPEAAEFGVAVLSGFYLRQAALYDWTRPFFLFGRREAVRRLDARSGHHVLDVGCGTGWNLALLASAGAEVTGVECSPAMLRRASARVARSRLADRVRLDPRPYGSHDGYEARADRVLFSYSLTMIPPFEAVLERVRRDLRPAGRIAVVDFLDAAWGVRHGLTASHVALGHERLDALKRLFPAHGLEVRQAGGWRYFLFVADAPDEIRLDVTRSSQAAAVRSGTLSRGPGR